MNSSVHLAYGRSGLEISLPVPADLISPKQIPGLPNEIISIKQSLRNPIGSEPLRNLISPGQSVVITHSDITRATPNHRILPVILDELEKSGVRRSEICLLNALGTHRQQTKAELRALLGEEIFDNYHCVQHNAFDDSLLVSLGETSYGNPVRINRLFLEADVRILTGFIEPHFFAGFSGGPKGVLPALAGAESVLSNHSQAMIAHPQASWGIMEGNPIWEEMREAALMTHPTFLLNVTLNHHKDITGVYAGDMLAAHAKGCQFARYISLAPVSAPYDVVLTTNSGYPLDQNLYQSVKGLSAAAQIVRRGGAILLVTACEDGLPNHGRYAALLEEAGSPARVLEMLSKPGFNQPDQWQVQIQAQIQQLAEVHVFSDGLTDEQIRRSLFIPCRDINQTLNKLVARFGPRVCVLPDGPLTIPYVTNPEIDTLERKN
jgi:nickel-dependent lactate racemase